MIFPHFVIVRIKRIYASYVALIAHPNIRARIVHSNLKGERNSACLSSISMESLVISNFVYIYTTYTSHACAVVVRPVHKIHKRKRLLIFCIDHQCCRHKERHSVFQEFKKKKFSVWRCFLVMRFEVSNSDRKCNKRKIINKVGTKTYFYPLTFYYFQLYKWVLKLRAVYFEVILWWMTLALPLQTVGVTQPPITMQYFSHVIECEPITWAEIDFMKRKCIFFLFLTDLISWDPFYVPWPSPRFRDSLTVFPACLFFTNM